MVSVSKRGFKDIVRNNVSNVNTNLIPSVSPSSGFIQDIHKGNPSESNATPGQDFNASPER
jgi:hypothetical protein